LNFPLFIAKRYLFSKKSHNIINIISWISISGVGIGTMALIIVLSVFNGFESLVISLFNSFNPEIQITAKLGKTFDGKSIPVGDIKKIPGVIFYNNVIEDVALLKHGDKQYIATVKGVEADFRKMSGLDSSMVAGTFLLEDGTKNYAVVGQGIKENLGLRLNDYTEPISVFTPRRGSASSIDPSDAFNTEYINPSGFFAVQQDFDTKYLIVPLRFTQKLFEYTNEVTSVEIGLSKGADHNAIQERIQKLCGDKFSVKNRFEQQELLYSIMKNEKWAIFIILSFILLIATFNVIGTLTMLILEKRKDVSILWSMGADSKTIRRIFLSEGLLISLIGAGCGLLIGGIICGLQQKFGIIQIQSGGSFVVSAYPINMQVLDFIYVFLTVFAIGFFGNWLPVLQISKKYLKVKFD
jgi:lipoprotein-releasing system permease protein